MSTETSETKVARLLGGLIDHTNKRTVRWEETAEEDMFRAQLHNNLVRIGEDHDHRGGRTYTIWLLDNEGRIVEEFEAQEGKEFRLMQELYKLARRSSRPVADLLDRMIAEVAPQRPGGPNP